jgi:hypothetical protein
MTEVPKHIELMARAIENSIRNARLTRAGSSWYIPEATAAHAALVAAGFAVVPREPTEAMEAAAAATKDGKYDELVASYAWEAMIEAAEKP